MPYVYILECNDGSYYTGSTWDMEKRLVEHEIGLGSNYTKKRRPVKLVFCEFFDSIENAFRREKQIQGWSKKKKQALIEKDFERVSELAKNYSQFGKPKE